MVFEPPTFGTRTDFEPDLPRDERTPKEKCEAKGGFWDVERQTCLLVKKKNKIITPKPRKQTGTQVLTEDEKAGGVKLPSGKVLVGLSEKEVEQVLQTQQAKEQTLTSQTLAGQEQFKLQEQQRVAGMRLAGGVGQFGQMPIDPTGLNVGEALTTGIVSSIPSALRLGVAGAGVGLAGGATVGALGGPIGAGAGAAIGAVAGFVGGISSGMISNFKSQRSDVTTAQQRILDEGKQTMKDWATLAKNDPANKVYYLGEYNKQSAQIDQAYRQMKLDTSRDLAKFETALPNLAEFESFYSAGGERDTLDIEMRNSLVAVAPEGYDMLELGFRRKENE